MLGNEELINIALSSELLPEAEAELKAVLSSRGVTDLSGHRAALHNELALDESDRVEKLRKVRTFMRWRTWIICALSFLSAIYGIYLIANPAKSHPGDDGSLMIIIGVAGVIFALVFERISIFWNERVLLRRPPTRLR
jgi:hypothetical protein